ncbi:hypothetical protein HHX47_DHR3000628 [Lentinula edodes]|nr:hypothetical protein HHX47_DHR3000628 [Lentinula edodes]
MQQPHALNKPLYTANAFLQLIPTSARTSAKKNLLNLGSVFVKQFSVFIPPGTVLLSRSSPVSLEGALALSVVVWRRRPAVRINIVIGIGHEVVLGNGMSVSCELEVRDMAGVLRRRANMDETRMSKMYCGSLFGVSNAFWLANVVSSETDAGRSGGIGDVGAGSK